MATAKKTVEATEKNLPEKLSLNEICLNDLTKQANIRKLKKELSKTLVPKITSKDDEGYELVKEKLKLSLKARSGIEATRKEHKAEALAYGKFVDGSAAELLEMVVKLQKPWKELKEAVDKAEEIKLEKEREAEQARTDAIEEKVNNIINVTANLIGANSESLKERLNLINSIVVDETYDEYQSVADEHKEKAVELLTNAINERETFEAQQEQMAKDRLEIEEGKAALATAQEEIAELQKYKLIPGSEGNNLHPVSHYTAPYAMQPAAQEDEQLAQEEKFTGELTRTTELYINLTEVEAVQAYAENLINVEVPDVGDEKLMAILVTMTENLSKLQKYVQSNTQE